MKELGKIVFGIAVGCWYIFVAWKLWGWFAVPLGAPGLSYLQAFGLYTLAASVLIWSFYADPDEANDKGVIIAVAKCITCAVLLGEGWVIRWIMGAA